MKREINIVMSSRFKLPHFFLATSLNLLVMCVVWYIYSVTTWSIITPDGQETFFPSRFQQFLILTVPVLASEIFVVSKFLKNLRRQKFRKAKNYAINVGINIVIWLVCLYSLEF